ncbi:universal stress protein [Ferrimonas futtsuensis]|uniref:universal stress protein n=1 Tax=Ferrimonas futtsuensis TaxID=364764 RepID=UPI000484E74D|nr:universal stress protein [Ferrimonas futtsuensis]
MYRATLLLSALEGELSLIRSKLRPLLRASSSPCQVVIHGESPPLQRFYLFDDQELAAAADHYKQQVNDWAQSLIAPLASGKVALELSYIWSKSLETAQKHWESESDLLVVYCPGKRVPPRFRRVIEQSQCPVLLLSDHPWPTRLSLLAAIDPFHKSDRPADMDVKIVNQALGLTRALNGEVSVVHSCYVPAYMVKYRSMIQSTHQQVIQEFIANNGWRKLNWRLLQGEPSQTLISYCQKHRIDILVMGLVARGLFQRQMTGSTSEQIMETLYCDLLLIPKSSA